MSISNGKNAENRQLNFGLSEVDFALSDRSITGHGTSQIGAIGGRIPPAEQTRSGYPPLQRRAWPVGYKVQLATKYSSWRFVTAE